MSHHVRSHRRGNYAAFFGISLLVLLGFTAIGIDSGWQRIAMTQLHNAADAGAHAGAMEFNGTLAGVEAAVERAVDITNANLVHGVSVGIDSDTSVSNLGIPSNTDLLVGRYDSIGANGCLLEEGCWTDVGDLPSTADYDPDLASGVVDVEQINAIRVDAEASVNTIFGAGAFGVSSIGAFNFSVARMPIYQGTECAFPFSIGDCSLADFMSGAGPAEPGAPADGCGRVMRLRLSSSQDDNAAAATPDFMGSANANTMRDMIQNTQDCPSDVAWDDILDGLTVNFNNGALPNVIQAIATELQQSGTAWDPNWGDCSVAWCDITTQGLCTTNVAGIYSNEADCLASSAQASWQTTCPVSTQGNGSQLNLPSCNNNGKNLRRDVLAFTMNSLSTSAPASCSPNGNQASDLGNFSGSAPVVGISTLIIYDVTIQRGSNKCGVGQNPPCPAGVSCNGRNAPSECYVPTGVWMDVYLSCTNEDGDWTDGVVHSGTATFLDKDKNEVALVQ